MPTEKEEERERFVQAIIKMDYFMNVGEGSCGDATSCDICSAGMELKTTKKY